MTIKKIEGHLQILQWMYILVVTLMALTTAGFILTMLEKCHRTQKINLLVAGSEFTKKR